MTPLGSIVLALAAALTLLLPRRAAIGALMCGTFLLPLGELIPIGGMHFNGVRIMVLVAVLRIVLKGEWKLEQFSKLDVLVVGQVALSALAYVSLRQTAESAVNRLGVGYEAILSYLVWRALFHDDQARKTAVKFLVGICAVIAVGMAIEYVTQRIVFSALGGITDAPSIRNGRPRCQGPFQHALIAGVFGASSLPLCLTLWWGRLTDRIYACIGVASAAVIVLASGSSTPAMCAVGAVGAMFLWPMRRQMKVLLGLVVIVLAVLHVVMEDPVWALVARGGVFGGSTGYYRYLLIDLFIRNFSDWWLVGTDRYIEWNRAYGLGMWDACNMYVRQGIDGGLVSLILFIAVIVEAFKRVNRQSRFGGLQEVTHPLAIWAFGACIAAHCLAFIGLNYFDGQIVSTWYMGVAFVGSLGTKLRAPVARPRSSGWTAARGQGTYSRPWLGTQGVTR